MYFNAETQARILTRFHFALAAGGDAVPGQGGDAAQPRHAVRARRPEAPDLPQGVARAPAGRDPAERAGGRPGPWPSRPGWTCCATRHCWPPVAQIVVTADGVLALANRQAEQLFGLSARDVGRPFRDLELSYRPLELRRHIEQAQAERRPVRVTDVALNRGGKTIRLEVQVSPLVDGANEVARRRPRRSTTSPTTAACRTSSSRPTASWRRPTRSCSPPTRSWRPPTRSSSRRSRSWRPPTRSCSPPTRSWRP